jgi:hypothetical protein
MIGHGLASVSSADLLRCHCKIRHCFVQDYAFHRIKYNGNRDGRSFTLTVPVLRRTNSLFEHDLFRQVAPTFRFVLCAPKRRFLLHCARDTRRVLSCARLLANDPLELGKTRAAIAARAQRPADVRDIMHSPAGESLADGVEPDREAGTDYGLQFDERAAVTETIPHDAGEDVLDRAAKGTCLTLALRRGSARAR